MTLKDIEYYKEGVLQILFDVQVSVYNAKYIGTPSGDDEDWVKSHGFFRHYFSQMRFVLVIQLAKLFSNSRNESYSFRKFIRILDSTLSPELDGLNRNKIYGESKKVELISELNFMLDEFKEEIDILMELRNNIYAHSKKVKTNGHVEKEEKKHSLSWPQLESLSELAFDFYNKISGAFQDAHFFFPNKSNWSPEWFVKRAASTRPPRPKK